jgi:DNA-binding CsgD family transcriptional regulator
MSDDVVARRDELRAIATFAMAVPDGGHALVLTGDAGIGKTALWQAGLGIAAASGLRVITSRSSPSETQIAFASIGDLFAPVVDETMPLLPRVQRRALERAFLMGESDGVAPDVRLLGLALVSILEVLARNSPVLVAIDDAQWVDTSSAGVLRFFLHRLPALPVGVLMTVRGRPVEAPFELERSFAHFRRLMVTPLSVGAIHTLLWERLHVALPRPVLLRVHAAAGGNPFYALELARAMVDGSIGAEADVVSLPDSLLALVEQRLTALPRPTARTLVAVAALAAPTITLMEPLGVTTVEELELAHQRGVLEFEGDRVRFTHPLLAPACYALLPQHRRRQVHSALADLDVDPEERARHLGLATVGPDEAVAEVLDHAAARARGRGAVQAAAELADRAVVLTPLGAGDALARRRIVAARRAVEAGDMVRARSLLDEVVASSPPGALRAEALRELAGVLGQSAGNPAATALLLRALDEPGIDERLRAAIFGALANMASVEGESSAAMAYAQAGLALAEELGDPETLVLCMTAFADITFWQTGRMCRETLERAIAIHQESQGLPGDDPRVTLAHNLGRAERFEESRGMWTQLISEGTERDDPDVAAQLFFMSRMEVGSGRWDDAVAICDQAMALARQTGREVVEPLCQMVLAEVASYRAEADPEQFTELVARARTLGHGGATHRLGRAFATLELSRHDPQRAWAHVEPRFEGLEELDEVGAQLAGSVGVEALVGTGALDSAEGLLRKLEHRASTAETALPSLAHRCRGLLLEARGEHAAALVELEAAAVLPDPPAGRNPFEQARTQLALGRVHRKLQHKKAARDTLGLALGSFELLGAPTWSESTRSELRRIGGRSSTPSELSETERRIVELVVAGRRNREVASELYLSPDTVAWNLSRIYRKLGVSSRTQLAAHLAMPTDP